MRPDHLDITAVLPRSCHAGPFDLEPPGGDAQGVTATRKLAERNDLLLNAKLEIERLKVMLSRAMRQ
jgi:hypothetical protein